MELSSKVLNNIFTFLEFISTKKLGLPLPLPKHILLNLVNPVIALAHRNIYI